MIQQAKKLTNPKEIKKAFNWLFFDITPEGSVPTAAMLEIVFLKERNGAIAKNSPIGEKAIALFTSNMLYVPSNFEQPLPPPLGLKDITVRIFFFMNEWLYIEANKVDFSESMDDVPLSNQRPQRDGNDVMMLNFVPLISIFKLAITQADVEIAEGVSDQDSSFTVPTLVKVGKSNYQVFDKGAGQYFIRRADTHAVIAQTHPHGRRVVEAYLEQKKALEES